jgi:hypothetical protein
MRSTTERAKNVLPNSIALRLLVPLTAFAVVAILLLSAGASSAQAGGNASVAADWWTHSTTPTVNVLDTIPRADTVVANTTNVFAQGAVNCTNIWSVNTSGNVSLYAKVPTDNNACHEGALALAPYAIPGACLTSCNVTYQPAPGSGQSGHRYGCGRQTVNQTLYDVVNGDLYEITNGGSTVLFVASFTVPTVSWESMGMTYDQVGTWNHDLVITSASHGMVWTVNQTGVVTQVAELNTYVAGPAVASMYFGAFGGDILVAEKTPGIVVAINTTGNVSTVTNWTKAIGVAFQSGGGACGWGGCSFGPNHDIFFLANYSSGAIEGFPASDFWGLQGQGIVAGGQNQGIASFRPDGVTTLFASNTARIGNIAFISCFGSNGGWGSWTPPADHGMGL